VSRRIRRRIAAPASTAAAVLIALVLSGCGAGFTALTNTQFVPGNGASADLGSIHLRNVLLVQDPSGDLTELHSAFVNTGADDILTSVSVQDAQPVSLPGGAVDIPPNQQISFGPNGTEILVTNLTRQPGQFTHIVYQFRNSGTIVVNALILTPESANS
jgi:hypothetical protein